MVVNIPTTYTKVFKQYLVIVNGLLSDKKRLTKTELDVLSNLLYIDNLYKHLPKDKRDILLFHKSTRERIRGSLLNMSEGSFNNVLNKLRQKGLVDGRSLKIVVPIVDNKIKLEFNLSINDSEEGSGGTSVNS
jgi:hypothetical protein